jgi:hypothetical protein
VAPQRVCTIWRSKEHQFPLAGDEPQFLSIRPVACCCTGIAVLAPESRQLVPSAIPEWLPKEVPYILESNLHLVFVAFLNEKKLLHRLLSFFQNPALDRESNPHSILIRI